MGNIERINNDIWNLVNEMRVHGAIVIWGAGASFEAGLPLYAQFSSMVWQVVDEFPIIKTDLGYDINYSAKKIIGEDINLIKDIFNYVEKYEDALLRFKQIFKAVNDRHNIGKSSVHEHLCKLIHAGYIKIVVSFNWDNLLEEAWKRLYGTNINDNKINLLKPHGDVGDLTTKWTFPNSPGTLSEADHEIISRVTQSAPSTLIILGYSESDQVIVEQLIRPNENKYKAFRISPTALDSIPFKASEALKKIYDEISKNHNDLWEHLDFSNQIGLEHAVMGYRLLPSDVTACARLPQIEDAKYKLEQAHSVIIKSPPGCGKSITAYQIAFDYLNLGWETVKFDNSKLNSSTDFRLENDGYKTLYIIDDAQQIQNSTVIKLIGHANKTQKIIITQTLTTSDFPVESVTISKEQSLRAIYDHYLENKNEVIQIVKTANKKVGRNIGDHLMETPFEYVLDLGLKEETPWMFNYSLRGGWENTKSQYSVAKEHKRADIILMLIALKQIITLDKSVDIKWIIESASKWGITSIWCEEVINFLYQEKMILDLKEIRTLHLQAAIRIIVYFSNQASEDECEKLYTLIQNQLINEQTSLQGVSWFFNLLFPFEAKHKIVSNVLTNEYCFQLMRRCFLQTEADNKVSALYVIDNVINRDGIIKYHEIFEHYGSVLKSWMEQVQNNSALALSHILNSLINENQGIKNSWVESLNIEKISSNLKSIDRDHLYDWAKFLDRLSYSQTKKWKNNFLVLLPKDEIHDVLQQTNHTNIFGMLEMLYTLSFLNKEYGHEEYYNCLHIIKESLQWNFSDTLDQLGLHFLMYFCGEQLFSIGRPDNLQKKAAKSFVECIKVDMLTNCIMMGTPRDWAHLFRFASEILRYDIKKMEAAIEGIDFEKLDKQTIQFWNDQPDELLMIIEIIKLFKSEEVDTWIFSHRNEIDVLKVSLIVASPQTAAYTLNSGKQVLLIDNSHISWNKSAEAINKLKSYNKNMCSSIIHSNRQLIEKSILKLTPLDWEEYYKFFVSLLKADAVFMSGLLNEIIVEEIKKAWMSKIDSLHYPDSRRKKALIGFQKLIKSIEDFTNNNEMEGAMHYLNTIIDEQLQKASE
ncbi:nSTAND3 domain-containing NTPase [Paenibacillus sp. FSL L8-0499]|uniref:nSTAND3 domain-containing NTPase n=1 Tax=Paenibacillus sp. FSL L8-0499 TaxID=2975334 RepID=UPI0030FC6AD6